jgi:hypothetical protein
MSRSGSLRLPGKLLEAASNRRPRGMTAAGALQSEPEQNPAYRPSSEIFFRVGNWECGVG